MKTHLLALLQDNCQTWFFVLSCKLSACVTHIKVFIQHLLSPVAVLANTNRLVKPKYRPG